MADTAIEWSDKVWNPVRGCSLVSKGYTNCYATRQAHRFSGPGGLYEGLTRLGANGPIWTGDVRLVPEKLDEPLHWRKPCRVFVNSMSDLFHEAVPDEYIDKVFAVMALCSRHTFQVLTKRAERMAEWSTPGFDNREHAVDGEILRLSDGESHLPPDGWPLPNVWLGVSVEDQARADERIPHLLRTPAAVRFLSCEPLLGPIEFSDVSGRSDAVKQLGKKSLSGIDWVIVGGESGPGARPCDLGWIRSIRDQCQFAGVPVFVKQIGSAPVSSCEAGTCNEIPGGCRDEWLNHPLCNRKGGDPSEWPVDLRVREFPATAPAVH